MKAVARKAPAGGAGFLSHLLSAVIIVFPILARGEVYQLPEIVVEEERYDEALSILRMKRTEDWDVKDDVSEVVDELEGVYIKRSGGKGGVASPLLRGADSEESLILIEGLRLLPRPYDLSVIPTDFFNEIELYYSSPSSLYGPDAVGGVLNFKGEPPEGNYLRVLMTQGAFSSTRVRMGFAQSIKRLTFYGGGFYGLTAGDYPYLYEGRKFYVENNESSAWGIHIGMGGESKWGKGAVRLFFVNREKGVPGSIYFPTSEAEQKDKYGMFTFSWFLPVNDNFSVEVKGGSSIYSLSFFDNVYIPSTAPSIFDDFIFDGAGILRWKKGKVRVEGGVEYYYHRREGSSVGVHFLKNFAFNSGVSFSLLKYLSFFALQRTDFFNVFSDRTTFRGGIVFRWNFMRFTAGTGTSYRVPTFNELYWQEDVFAKGNPELKPEKGFDINATLSVRFPHIFNLKGALGFSVISMRDMIQWGLWEGKWSPRNIYSADIYQGFLKTNVQLWKFSPFFQVTYTYTSSSLGKLPYRPYWTFNEGFEFRWRKFLWKTTVEYTGKRYGSYGGSGVLPWYLIVASIVGVKFEPFFFLLKGSYTFCEEDTCMDTAGYPVPLYDFNFTAGIKTI